MAVQDADSNVIDVVITLSPEMRDWARAHMAAHPETTPQQLFELVRKRVFTMERIDSVPSGW